MNAHLVFLTAGLVAIASGAYAEGNNLADVEVPASTGVYQTTTILPPAARGYVTTAGAPPQCQAYEAIGGRSEAAVTAWGNAYGGQQLTRR